MNLLIITPPYDPLGGRGIPPDRYSWMIGLLQENGINSTLIQSGACDELRAMILDRQPDLVFSPAFTVRSADASPVVIHRLLEEMGIPYIGSPPETLEIALNKARFKRKLRLHAIQTPEYWTCSNGKYFYGDGHKTNCPDRFPFIIKPLREGNSRGISEKSIVWNQAEMDARLKELLPRYPELLIERYLGGDRDLREFTVAMIGNDARRMLMPAELILLTKRNRRVITMADKNQHGTRAEPVTEAGLKGRLTRLAHTVFKLINARDYSRCDVLLSGGKLQVLEANGQPMIPDKWFGACARGAGMNQRQYCLAIFQAALDRFDQLSGLPCSP
ncbi:MAG: hypothetical protein JW704_00805 [Anaerolineaceae bacterium]|nr:hypothetical protein [Anaerolineaceae bacterium]